MTGLTNESDWKTQTHTTITAAMNEMMRTRPMLPP